MNARHTCFCGVLLTVLAFSASDHRVFAFSLFPDARSGAPSTDLEMAARWSPAPDPFGDGTGFHDGIQVAVAPDFGAMLGLSTPTDLARVQQVIRAALAAWETADLKFDVDFARTPVEGTLPGGESGFELDLFAVPAAHPAFGNTNYFGITYTYRESAADRLLSNGQRFAGEVITGTDIFINVDTVLALGALLPPDRQAEALQRLLMHEIGHALGLGHPNTFSDHNSNFDTDGDALNAMPLDPRDPFVLLTYSEARNAQAVMSNDRSRLGRFLFFTAIQNDDRGGRDALYPRSSFCGGDCDGDGEVDVSELVTAVAMVLGEAPLRACPSADNVRDGAVFVDEVTLAIDHALRGCSDARQQLPAQSVPQLSDAARHGEVASVRCALPADLTATTTGRSVP